ncbi:hypothetical protein AB0D42_34460 [Streptomyces sp. NPDC048304]|uniref:hypothetical protein n=1 Tax=Streptomyces sp. NPDC048304 TaxID=3154820 RepID=UPI0033E0D878
MLPRTVANTAARMPGRQVGRASAGHGPWYGTWPRLRWRSLPMPPEGIRPASPRAFATRVRQELGLTSPAAMIKSNGRKYYPGIALAWAE